VLFHTLPREAINCDGLKKCINKLTLMKLEPKFGILIFRLYTWRLVAKARPLGHFWHAEVQRMVLGSFLNVMPFTL
jgi:hypothetical protein